MISKSAEETKKFGEEFAKTIVLKNKAFVIGLKGDLGGGKTTFMQGFAKGLGIEEKILSPTFVILKVFKIKTKNQIPKTKNLYHIDCYRIKNEKDLISLGFKDIIEDKENIVVVEWPEKVKKVMPKDTIYIEFEFVDENTRNIWIKKN